MSQQSDCKSTLERAFEVAESGRVSSVRELEKVLQDEGYYTTVLMGPLLLRQLRDRIVAATLPH